MSEAQNMSRADFFYVSYIVVFGCAMGFGSSILEVVQLPYVNFTAATPWVIAIITLSKLVFAKRFAVTHIYIVAGFIAIFTPYFGPPSILGLSAILAGLSFDLASRLKTFNISLFDLLAGHFAATVVGFCLVWLIYLIHLPDLAPNLIWVFVIAGFWHFGVAVLASIVLFKAFPPSEPSAQVKAIRDSITHDG